MQGVDFCFIHAIIELMSKVELFSEAVVKLSSPFIKWAGGKSSLVRQFNPYFPHSKSYKRYFEPFIGGGAVFFHLQPPESYLFDLNPQLIGVYEVVRDQVDDLIESLKEHKNEAEYFYQIRKLAPQSLNKVESASRFIYLNKTCYNGLYRENSSGGFNVPFGKYKNPKICDEDGLRSASRALQRAHLQVGDFEQVQQYAQSGDLIYFDPPYDPLNKTLNFTSYTSKGFNGNDQRRLGSIFRELNDRKCLLMLSNSDTPLIREIYEDFNLFTINARRAINSNPNGRGEIVELLITNFTNSSEI